MQGGWKLFLLFGIFFVAAFAAERLLVPQVVPVGFSDEPQALWSVETAFVLRAIELMSGGVAILALLAVVAAWAKQRLSQIAR